MPLCGGANANKKPVFPHFNMGELPLAANHHIETFPAMQAPCSSRQGHTKHKRSYSAVPISSLAFSLIKQLYWSKRPFSCGGYFFFEMLTLQINFSKQLCVPCCFNGFCFPRKYFSFKTSICIFTTNFQEINLQKKI